MNAPYSLRWVTFSTHSHGTYASGYVYDNPKFVDGYFIDTSYIQSMTLEGTALTLQTRNSRYVCSLDELCGSEEDTQQVIDLLTSFLPHATFAELTLMMSPPELPSTDLTDEAFQALCQQLEALADLPPNCFVLCLDLKRSCDYLFSGFFKKQADNTVEVVLKKPLVHLGMFQDSVLCMGATDTDEAFDLRYFPYTDGISFYRPVWDMPPEEEPQQVYYLCNVGERPLNVDDIPLPHMACYKVPAGKHGGQ